MNYCWTHTDLTLNKIEQNKRYESLKKTKNFLKIGKENVMIRLTGGAHVTKQQIKTTDKRYKSPKRKTKYNTEKFKLFFKYTIISPSASWKILLKPEIAKYTFIFKTNHGI